MTDHRAEAVSCASTAVQRENQSDELGGIVHALVGLTHATLAAGTPVVDRHVAGALLAERARASLLEKELDGLREAVLELVRRSHDETSMGRGVSVDPASFARLRDLAGGAR